MGKFATCADQKTQLRNHTVTYLRVTPHWEERGLVSLLFVIEQLHHRRDHRSEQSSEENAKRIYSPRGGASLMDGFILISL